MRYGNFNFFFQINMKHFLYRIAILPAGSHGPEVINFDFLHVQFKFIRLINVKMPTIVGIKTFIRGINITSESSKARTIIIFSVFLAFMSS